MINLIKGIWVLIWAIGITIIQVPIGFLYNIGYAYWSAKRLEGRKGNKILAFIKHMWKIIDGILFSIGYMLYQIAYSLDLIWNVNGEIIEDIITSEDKTTFGEKETAVSASTGRLEINSKLNSKGNIFSKALNIFFWQKQHAVDSALFEDAKKELKTKYFEKRKLMK